MNHAGFNRGIPKTSSVKISSTRRSFPTFRSRTGCPAECRRVDEGCRGHECARADCPRRFAIWPIASADGIICINMVHISPWDASVGLIRGAAAILPPGSPLYLYGPYKRKGFATALSNQAFDRNLRDRNPTWGLRDLEAVAAIAQSAGFSVRLSPKCPQTI
jgi:Protein of unknown function (DUF938)